VLTNVLGFGAACQQNYERAKGYLAEGLTLRKELNDRDGATYTLWLLGTVSLFQKHYAEAIEYLNEALVLSREVGNSFMTGVVLSRLGPAVSGQGQDQLALQYLIEGLELSHVTKDKNYSVLCLNELAGLMGKWGQWERSARLLGAVSVQLEGVLPIWIGPGVHERYVAAAQANMAETAFTAAWSSGQKMTLEEAITLYLEK
jgi:tetratricopeptide (TPR) repeat protein